jgi:adenylate cyclase
MTIPRLLKTKSAMVAMLAAAILIVMTLLRSYDPGPIVHLRERTFDIYQQLQPRPYADFPVRVIDIDEASLAKHGQFPWPRSLMARFVQRLNALGAAVIALDILFPEPDRTSPHQFVNQVTMPDGAEAERVKKFILQLPDNDQLFAEAIKQAPVVLGFSTSNIANSSRPPVKTGYAIAGASPAEVVHPFTGAEISLDIFNAAASGIGSLNISSKDKSGIIRRVPLLFTDGAKIYPNLGVEALRVAQQQVSVVTRGTGASREIGAANAAMVDMRIGEFALPLTAEGELWVYFDHDRPERYVSAKDVLDPAKDAEVRPKIEGQIVFVGTSVIGLKDVWPSPLGELVPGTSIHAQALEQILSQTFLVRPDWALGAEITATLVLGALLTWLLLVLGAQYAALAGIGIIGSGLGLSWFAFSHGGTLLDPVYPSIMLGTTYLVIVGVLYFTTDQEKKFVQRAFGQYLAPALLARLVHAPSMMRLGGENKNLSILFMDVRDFTPISEGLSPEELVDFMNQLLSPLSDAIQSELGTIDKYIGDSIMAFWNAPVDIDQHPVRACRAALKMRAALVELNSTDAFGFRDRGLEPVKIGIGLHTGLACVGNMGSQRRFNYTAMGDVVNTAARIESSSKAVGMDLVVSEEVGRMAPGFAFLEAGAMPLKGKSQPMKLLALVGDEEKAVSAEFVELSKRHAELLAAIADGRAADASHVLAHCRALGGTLLSSFYNRFEEQIAEISPGAVRVA